MLIFEKEQTEAPFVLTIDQEGVGGLTGLSPTIAFRDATTLNSYLDFDDFTFKTTGIITQYVQLDEVGRGHYTYSLDPSSISGISIGTTLVAEYRLNESGLIADTHETALFVESITDIPTATTDILGVISGLTPTQAAHLKELWQIFGLDPANPLVVTPTHRSAGTEIDQTIDADTPIPGAVTVTKQP